MGLGFRMRLDFSKVLIFTRVLVFAWVLGLRSSFSSLPFVSVDLYISSSRRIVKHFDLQRLFVPEVILSSR